MFTIISYFVCSLLIFIMAWMGLGSSLFPLILSFVFAYFSFPIILKLENKGISRVKSASIVFILLILLNLVLAAFIIPVIYRDIVFFMKELPMNVSKLFIEIKDILGAFIVEDSSIGV